MPDVQRDLGRMESQINQLVTQVESLTRKVEDIQNTLQEARGGWRTLVILAGAAATVGGMLVKFLPFKIG